MNNDLVSIIVPVYNLESYIEKCLNSIKNQTYSNLEVIVIDDGSTDKSKEIIDSFATDNRFFVYSNSNHGVSYTRNFGIEHSHGRYLLFVDGDDYIENDFVEKLYEAITASKTKITVCGYNIVKDSETKSVKYNSKLITKNEYLNNIINYNLAPWNKIYDRCLFEKVRFQVGVDAEDVLILPELLEQCDSIQIINCCLYNYVVRESSFTHRKYTVKHLDIPLAFIYLSNYIMDNGDKNGMISVLNATIHKIVIALINKSKNTEFDGKLHEIKDKFRLVIKKARKDGRSLKYVIYWKMSLCFPCLVYKIMESRWNGR